MLHVTYFQLGRVQLPLELRVSHLRVRELQVLLRLVRPVHLPLEPQEEQLLRPEELLPLTAPQELLPPLVSHLHSFFLSYGGC